MKRVFKKTIVAVITMITMICSYVPAMADDGVTCDLDGKVGVPVGTQIVLDIPEGTSIDTESITVSPEVDFSYADGKITFTNNLNYDTAYTLKVGEKTFSFKTAYEANRSVLSPSDKTAKTLNTGKSNFTYEQINENVLTNPTSTNTTLIYLENSNNANNQMIINQTYDAVQKNCSVYCTVRLDKNGVKTDVLTAEKARIATVDGFPKGLVYTFRDGVVEVYEVTDNNYIFLGSKNIKEASEEAGTEYSNFKFNKIRADHPDWHTCKITESDITPPAAPSDVTVTRNNQSYGGDYMNIRFKGVDDSEVKAYKLQVVLDNNSNYKVFERVISVGDERLSLGTDGYYTIKSGILPHSRFTYRVYSVKEVDDTNILSQTFAYNGPSAISSPGKWTWGVYNQNGDNVSNLTLNGNPRPLGICAKLYCDQTYLNPIFGVSGDGVLTSAQKLCSMNAVIAIYDIKNGKSVLKDCRIYDPAIEPVLWQRNDLTTNTRVAVMLLDNIENMKPIYQEAGGYVNGNGIAHDYAN